MTQAQAVTETRSVVVEREIPHPPAKIWRALTQPHLIAEWLMKNDFQPVVGRGPEPGQHEDPDVSKLGCLLGIRFRKCLGKWWVS